MFTRPVMACSNRTETDVFEPPARALSSKSNRARCSLLCARARAFARGGAAPPLTPTPLPPHATDACSRCSQVIRWADNLKITIFYILFTFSPRCTWASFEALLGGRFVVAFRTAFPLSVTFAPDSFCSRSVGLALRLVHTFLASVVLVAASASDLGFSVVLSRV